MDLDLYRSSGWSSVKRARIKCAELCHAAFGVRSEKRVGLETACWVFYLVMLVSHAVRSGTVPGSWVSIFVEFGRWRTDCLEGWT